MFFPSDSHSRINDYLIAINDICVSGCPLDEVNNIIKHIHKGAVRLVAESPYAVGHIRNGNESSRKGLKETGTEIGVRASRKQTGNEVPRVVSWEGIGNEDYGVRSSSIPHGGYHETGPECESRDKSAEPRDINVKSRHSAKLREIGTESHVVRRFKHVEDHRERPRSEILETNNDLIDKESKKRMKKKSSVKERLGRVFGKDSRNSTKHSQKISSPLNRGDKWKKSRSLDKLDSDDVLDLAGERKMSEPKPLTSGHSLETGTSPSPRTVASIIAETVDPSSDDQAGSGDSVKQGGSSSRAKVRRKRRSLYEIPPPPPPPPTDGGDGEHDPPPTRPTRCFSYPDMDVRTVDGQEWFVANPKQTSLTKPAAQNLPYVNLSGSEGNVIEHTNSERATEKEFSLSFQANHELQSSLPTNMNRSEDNVTKSYDYEQAKIQASTTNDLPINSFSLTDQPKGHISKNVQPIQSMEPLQSIESIQSIELPRTSSHPKRKSDINSPAESQRDSFIYPEQKSVYSPKKTSLHSTSSIEATRRTDDSDNLIRSESYSTTPERLPTRGSVSSPQKNSVSATQTKMSNSQPSVDKVGQQDTNRTKPQDDRRCQVSAKPISAVPTYIPRDSRLNSQSSNDISNQIEISENLTRTLSDPLPEPIRHTKLPKDNHIKAIPPPPENLRYIPQRISHSQSVSQISSGTKQSEIHPTRALSDPVIAPIIFPEVTKMPDSSSKPPTVPKPVISPKPSVPPKPRLSPKPSASSTRVRSPVLKNTDNSYQPRNSESIKSKNKELASPSRINRDSTGKREMISDKYVHQGTHDDNDEVFIKPQDENKSPCSYPVPVRKRRSSLPEEDLTSSNDKRRAESKPRPKTMMLPQDVQDEGVFTVQVCTVVTPTKSNR